MPSGYVLLCAVMLLWPAPDTDSLASGIPATNDPATANVPSVRTLDVLAAQLVADGLRRSETFRRIVSTLQDTDVVAYVHTTANLPAGCDGVLRFVSTAGGLRYVRASIDATKPRDLMISMIAHELQHALELAGDTHVRSEDAFRAFFRMMNTNRPIGSWVDSAEARDVTRRVRQELATG